MSLQTDILFYRTIKRSSTIMAKIGNRLYNPAVDTPEENLENIPIPYIVVMNQGTDNDDGSKDDIMESDYDNDAVDVLVVAENRPALAELANEVRVAIRKEISSPTENTMQLFGFEIQGYHFKASPVSSDITTPCTFQTLSYICETLNI